MGVNNARFFFVLLAIAAAIGVGNIWLYPYYSYKFGGLFFVSYLFALLLIGVPLLMLEFSVGQFFNKNVVDLFASTRKWFSSIGWLITANAFIFMSVYAVILSWHMIYFFVSFGLQWKEDAKAYFFNNVLQVSNGFRGFTQFSLPVFIALIATWLIIFFYIRKGFESIKKAFLITFPVFLMLMFLFLAYSLSIDNALNGVYSFIKPRFSTLLSIDLWFQSFSLAIMSLGLSLGIMHAVARKSKGFILGASSAVVLFELVISIAIGFILFGVLGFMSAKINVGLESIVFKDPSSFFTILTQSLPFFYKPTLFSILFFVFFSLIYIFATASLAYSISHVLVDKFNTKHVNAAIIVAGFGFLFGLAFIIKPGYYIMDIVSHFAVYNILICILLETIAIGWFYDTQKIQDFINQNSLLRIGSIWHFFIKYIAPSVLILVILMHLKADYLLTYNDYPVIYLLIFGVGTVAIPLIVAFLMPRRILDRR